MNDTTKQAIFDELMAASGVVMQQEHHFTIREFAESQGVSGVTAARLLEELRAKGKLYREHIRTHNGKRAWGYWVPEDEK